MRHQFSCNYHGILREPEYGITKRPSCSSTTRSRCPLAASDIVLLSTVRRLPDWLLGIEPSRTWLLKSHMKSSATATVSMKKHQIKSNHADQCSFRSPQSAVRLSVNRGRTTVRRTGDMETAHLNDRCLPICAKCRPTLRPLAIWPATTIQVSN